MDININNMKPKLLTHCNKCNRTTFDTVKKCRRCGGKVIVESEKYLEKNKIAVDKSK